MAKLPTMKSTSLDIVLEDVEHLDVNWEKMSPSSPGFCIGKFQQEVADKKGERDFLCHYFTMSKTC